MPARRRPLGQVPAGGPAASLREGAVCAVGKDQRWLLPLCTTLLPLPHPLRDALRNQTGLHGATRGGSDVPLEGCAGCASADQPR